MAFIELIFLFGHVFPSHSLNRFWLILLSWGRVKQARMERIKEKFKFNVTKPMWLTDKPGKRYRKPGSYVQNRRESSVEGLYRIAKIKNVDFRGLVPSART
jgi:putative transcriptional regulator